MCTCIELKNSNFYFGRNLDLEYRFNEKVIVTPKEYGFKLKNGEEIQTKYAIIGMATDMNGYPLYAEATNDAGLCIAGLYFPNNAKFFDIKESKLNLAPYELIPYFLGQYTSVKEILSLLENLNIINIPFTPNMPIADLHWMISDQYDCIVLEQTKNGLNIYKNDIGVLTNNPEFPYHRQNICNYMNLSTNRGVNNFSNKVELASYGQGIGAIGLPGDCSPSSRFIRAGFNKLNSNFNDNEDSSVAQFFHILDSVAMVKGSVVTDEGVDDITTYSCCINATQGIYYYKTYTNNQINVVRLNNENTNCDSITVYELLENQNYNYIN